MEGFVIFLLLVFGILIIAGLAAAETSTPEKLIDEMEASVEREIDEASKEFQKRVS